MEVRSLGIDVIVIEPGGINSEWSKVAYDHLLKASGYEKSPYKQGVNNFLKILEGAEGKNFEPVVISALIFKAGETKNPKTRYVGGMDGKTCNAL